MLEVQKSFMYYYHSLPVMIDATLLPFKGVIITDGLLGTMNVFLGSGVKKQMKDIESMVDEKQLARTEAIVLSMTIAERRNPKLLNPSRKHRIARGAGVDIADVNRFVKQFEQTQKMMKQMPGMMGGKRGRGFGGMRFPF